MGRGMITKRNNRLWYSGNDLHEQRGIIDCGIVGMVYMNNSITYLTPCYLLSATYYPTR
jgi:hypothetical protein